MTARALILLGLAGAAAVADWVVVWRRPAHERAETVLKPLVLVLLIAVALTLDPAEGAQRPWLVAGLVLSLAGDVFLLPSVDRFVPGLASFLLAHLAYIVGFVLEPTSDTIHLWPMLLIGPGISIVLPIILRGARATEPALGPPVVLYTATIGAMVVTAAFTGDWVASLGAVTFAVSDSILALDRFDRHRRWMPLAVMVTYHAAQALLVASLVQSP